MFGSEYWKGDIVFGPLYGAGRRKAVTVAALPTRQKWSVAQAKRRAREAQYDPTLLIQIVNEKLTATGETQRGASEQAGLDHAAIDRILAGQRPNVVTCLLLADHWGLNPNDLLESAGWPRIGLFNHYSDLSDEARQVALRLQAVEDEDQRRQAFCILNSILDHF